MTIKAGRAALALTTAAALAAAVIACAAASSQIAVSGAGMPAAEVSWTACGDGLQCAQVSTAVNWRDPDGKTIDIALAKYPAENQASKLGPLLVNLGGPVANIPGFRKYKAEFTELTKWFDVIVFEARGFGGSAGVTCPSSPSISGSLVAAPFDRRQWQEQERKGSDFDLGCRAALGELAGNLDAWQVAHDMDAVRAALGQEKLTYYGNSYGTVYGQAYAELFPGRVRRMYLDSVVDHTETSEYRLYAPIAQQVRDDLPRITDWCNREPRCALHGQDVLAVWDRVLDKAARQPIPARGTEKVLTAGDLRANGGLTIEGMWPYLTQALAKADAGDAADFVNPPFPVPVPPADVSFQAQCADFPAPEYGRTGQLMNELKTIEPRVGWLSPLGWPQKCLGLPAATYPPHPIHAQGLPPVLLANGIHDFVAAPSMGRHVAAQLPRARWFGLDGHHSVYEHGNSKCVRDYVHRYLTSGELPPQGSICPKP